MRIRRSFSLWLNLGVRASVFLLLFLLWLIFSLMPLTWGGPGQTKAFLVEPGVIVREVAEKLGAEKLVRSALAWRLLVGRRKVAAGEYLLSPRMSGWQVAQILTSGKSQRIAVTIPEGWTNKQIREALSEKTLLKADQPFPWLVGREAFPWLPAQASSLALEGFLFPDTYFFNPHSSAGEITETLLNNFQRRTSELEDKISSSSFSLLELVTLASIVEREGKSEEEMRQIAAVLFNRLKQGMRLDADATVRYALNQWSSPLTAEELTVDSPYNTRRRAGLPPGPIGNPGLKALEAVLEAPSSDFFYYLTDSSGQTHFAKTLAEHNEQKLRFLQ